jgi:hypothetical protein
VRVSASVGLLGYAGTVGWASWLVASRTSENALSSVSWKSRIASSASSMLMSPRPTSASV